MTNEELQEIVAAVLQALATNSKTIEQLTAVAQMSDSDYLELDGGRKVSYATLLYGYLKTATFDNAMTNIINLMASLKGNAANLPGTELDKLYWRQSPIVLLSSMGEYYDGDDDYTPQTGDIVYDGLDSTGYQLHEKKATGWDHYVVSQGVLYVNKRTGKMYEWTGSQTAWRLIVDPGGGGGGSIIKDVKYENGYLVFTFDTEQGDEVVSVPVDFDASNYVPITRTVNGKALSQNITIGLSDISGLVAALAAKVSGIKVNNGETQTPTNGVVNLEIQGGSSVDVVDNLNSTDGTKALSAKQGKVLDEKIAGKQNTLTFDNAPTSGSNNPVKSGGVYTALQTLLSNITVGQNGNWYVGETDTGVKAQGPKGNSVVDGDTFEIVNNLIDGGEGDALSAEMGKQLGDSAKVGMYFGAPSGETPDTPEEPEDVDVTFDNTELVSGKRIAAGVGGIGNINTDNTRATIAIMYYIGAGEAPAGTEKLDLSKFKSFTVPTGYYGSPTFAKATTQNAQAVYPTGWQTGTYTITDGNRTTVAEYPYMVWNFGKGSSQNQTIGSADLDALIAGFKMTLEGEEVEPVQPAFVQHKAVSVVDENGDEVLAMSSPAATEGCETEVYSKDAVDALLDEFAPESEDINYRLPKVGVETDDVEVKTFPSSDFAIGVRIVGGVGGITAVSGNVMRATLNKIYYTGEGDAPSGTEKLDLSKFTSFNVPSGYNGSPTFAAGLQQNASAVYPTGWKTGRYSITAEDRTAATGYPYMVFNFSKGTGSETIGSSDLSAIAEGFDIVCESSATDPADAAINIVDEEGEPVKQIYNGGDRDTVEIYSKSAVDELLSNVTPNPFDSSNVRRALRVTHWNVGQFSLGAASQGTQLTTNFVKKWQNKLRQIGADVMLMCEFYTDNDKVSSIFSDYVYQNTDRLSGSGNYIWSAIMSNIALGDVERVVFNNQSNRNFLAATISLGKWSVTLIECHLYFNGSETATRAAQMQQIIDYCANIDRVVICGDFNNADITEYAVFKNAGYQMFNYDLFNRVNTYPATGLTDTNYTSGFPSIAIDNIMCKGCSIVAAEVVDDGSLTDHCGIVCDLILTD